MIKLHNLFVILCAIFLLNNRKYVDAKAQLSSPPIGSRSSFGSSKAIGSYHPILDDRPRPYPSLGYNRFTPSVPHVNHNLFEPNASDNNNNHWAFNTARELNNFTPTYGYSWMPIQRTLPSTERPWSGLDNNSINQTVIKRVRKIVKQTTSRFIRMNDITKEAYKNANRKILKLIDYDGKRKSYVVHHPLQQGELRFHAM